MFGLNGFAFICFSAVNIIAVYLCRLSYHKRRLVLSMLSLLLLSVRLLFLFQDREVLQRIPVEFSAVAYFAVPLIILSGSRKLLPWASYSGLIAGFFYYATMIIAGGKIYAEYSVNEIYLSLFSHGVLFICGFSLAATEHFEKRNVFPFPLYCAAIGTHAVLWRPFVGINGSFSGNAESGNSCFLYCSWSCCFVHDISFYLYK